MANRFVLVFCGAFFLIACSGYERSREVSATDLDIAPDEIYIDEETEEILSALHAEHPNGISSGFRGTYRQSIPDKPQTYLIDSEEEFRAEFVLGSSRIVAHSYIFICLLNHVQVPCQKGEKPAQYVEGVASGSEVKIPLQLTSESRLSDLIMVFQEDPYLPGPIGSGSFQDRTLKDLSQQRVNLIRGDSVTAIEPDYREFEGQLGQESIRPRGFVPSESLDARGSQGGWQIWTEGSAQSGEFFDFYLHFDSNQDQKYALLAFLDFEQVPIYVEDEALLPFYLQTRARTHLALPVRIRAPEEPGEYELRLLAICDPFTQLDQLSAGEIEFLEGDPSLSSPRILLKVE